MTLDLFVPGRLCLFGEHSDWASRYRAMNAGIQKGIAIVTGIEQGIYATVSNNPLFIIKTATKDGIFSEISLDMDIDKLKGVAAEGGFFSYAAGVAAYMCEHYQVGGLQIEITESTLLVKKGLSSSASICVLTARAFNRLYDLHLSTRGEMVAAYRGELLTPSRCGRLDQACAFGSTPVVIRFDGDEIEVTPLRVKQPFYWVFADLNAKKDTIKILSDLNHCYPFPENEISQRVHEALGVDNQHIVEDVIAVMESIPSNDRASARLGALMNHAQELFDEKITPACPSELTAPVLHDVLMDKKVTKLSYGGKGVGSGGDGTVQLLARDAASQAQLIQYLQTERGMDAYSLTILPRQRVRKAIVTVAGFGTRLFPATRFIKKDLFPIIDRDGLCKPLLLILLSELDRAGIEEICLVVGSGETVLYEDYFKRALPEEHLQKLPIAALEQEEYIHRLYRKITFVTQEQRQGFGNAVFQAKRFTNDEPTILLLGDHIYKSHTSVSCTEQMLETFLKTGNTTVGIKKIPLDEVIHYGILGGYFNHNERILQVTAMAEKPDKQYAEDFLGVKTKENKHDYFGIFGQYILTKEAFDKLAQQNHTTSGNEVGLMEALDELRKEQSLTAVSIDGDSYDIGMPHMYLKSLENFFL